MRTSTGTIATIALTILVLSGCGPNGGTGEASSAPPPDTPPAPAPLFGAIVEVRDEDGAPLPIASLTFDGIPTPVDANARRTFTALDQPILAVATAPGHLPEPVVIGREHAGAVVPVRLLRDAGLNGERRAVLHFAGDSMLARRYVEPTREGTAVVTPGDGGASARAVVASIAPLFRAAHARSLNLESVIGTLPLSAAYPKKRFLLQSPPEIVPAFDELSVDVVALGNNHSRDWLEDGITSTIENLDAAAVAYLGTGLDAGAAAGVLTIDVAGYRVGFLSYTTVDGDFVNDSLPRDADPEPADLPASEAWQYERRFFGFTGPSVSIPVDSRRIGEAWRLIEPADAAAQDELERADLWAAATAVYPELQDWVARRGHGGANRWSRARARADIAALRGAGCDLVFVHLHAGFQFLEVKSDGAETAAHAAIDEGADAVIGHHPHVLQGFEWYQGKLIAYSLGNFIFDQDFLVTFPTVVLRLVFEETALLEARVYPAALADYRPVPLAGEAARSIVRALHERSVAEAYTVRIGGLALAVLDASGPGVERASLVLERGSGRILAGVRPTTATAVAIASDAATSLLPVGPLTRSRGPGGAALPGVLLGRDLFQAGGFEDESADGEARGGMHWSLGERGRAEAIADAPGGVRALRLRSTSQRSAQARSVARMPLPAHRLWIDAGGGAATPADGDAFYSARFWAKLEGKGAPVLRLDVYHFDDTNPTEDPESLLIRTVEVPLSIPRDPQWREHLVDLPAEAFAPAEDGKLANAVLPYLRVGRAGGDPTVLLVDQFQFIEWRAADALPDGFYALDAARAADAGSAGAIVLERTTE